MAVTDAASPQDAPDPRERELCEELLGYLREHPHAMDSLEGIAEWWLPRHQIRVGVERIARALETLTRRGMLQEVEDGDRLLYRLRPDPDGRP
jgi:hypothetical protein